MRPFKTFIVLAVVLLSINSPAKADPPEDDDCYPECEAQLYNIEQSNPYIGQPEVIEYHSWLRDAYAAEYSIWYADLLSYVAWMEGQIEDMNVYLVNEYGAEFDALWGQCQWAPCTPQLLTRRETT